MTVIGMTVIGVTMEADIVFAKKDIPAKIVTFQPFNGIAKLKTPD